MIVLDNPAHGFMIAHRAGVGFDPNVNRVLAHTSDDGLLGGVVYTNYTGRSVQMHMAGDPGWVTSKMIWIAFDYPFNQLGVECVIGLVSEDQVDVLDYDRRLGFKEIARVPGIVPGGDLIVLSMMRNECKWLSLRSRFVKANGQAGELAA
jgi:hypothetical protein